MSKPNATIIAAVPLIWKPFIAFIEGLLKSLGASALPQIEAWLEKLPLPPTVIAMIEALLAQYLGNAAPKLKFTVHP